MPDFDFDAFNHENDNEEFVETSNSVEAIADLNDGRSVDDWKM
jgi:hypothetical protein